MHNATVALNEQWKVK